MSTDTLVERLRAKMKRAEPLPWAWEQCGDKCDDPVVGVIVDRDAQPKAGLVTEADYGGDDDSLQRWSIAVEWGSGIDSSSPSANADFVVETVNALPALLDRLESYAVLLAEARDLLRRVGRIGDSSICHSMADKIDEALSSSSVGG